MHYICFFAMSKNTIVMIVPFVINKEEEAYNKAEDSKPLSQLTWVCAGTSPLGWCNPHANTIDTFL